MASLRQVKKNIRNLCGDIATECVVAGTLFQGADEKKLADVVYKAAKLQTESIRKLSVSFDKGPKDFQSKKDYRKARRDYFRQAIASLDSTFTKEAEGLLAELNQAVPKDKSRE